MAWSFVGELQNQTSGVWKVVASALPACLQHASLQNCNFMSWWPPTLCPMLLSLRSFIPHFCSPLGLPLLQKHESVLCFFFVDPLRVLRAVRFCARLNFTLEESLKESAASEKVRTAAAEASTRAMTLSAFELVLPPVHTILACQSAAI